MFPTFMMKGLNSKVLTKHGKGKLEYLRASGNSTEFQESTGSVVGNQTSYNLLHVSGITIIHENIYSLQLSDKCILNNSQGYVMHN